MKLNIFNNRDEIILFILFVIIHLLPKQVLEGVFSAKRINKEYIVDGEEIEEPSSNYTAKFE